MARAIQLYRKLFLRAIEIENKLADAVLAAELAAGELAAFQVIPKHGFGGSEVAAEGAAVVFFMREVVEDGYMLF